MGLTGHYSNPRAPLRRLAELDLHLGDPRATASVAVSPNGRRSIQRRLRPEELAELVAGYTAGSTAREVAERFGIHRTTVIAHLERQGVPVRRGRGLQPDEIYEAARLYEEGWSAARLSKRFGVSNHTVSAALRKAGVRIRSRGAAACCV